MNLNEIAKTYYLPRALRSELKKVWGTAILGKNSEVFEKCQKFIREKGFEKIITVGDYCSLALPSDVKVFDGKVKRKEIEHDLPYSLKLSNPAGTIQKKSWSVLSKAIENNENVFVDGEEDLLVVPVVLLSKPGTAVVYGMPDKGICVIEPLPEVKKRFKELLGKFSLKPF